MKRRSSKLKRTGTVKTIVLLFITVVQLFPLYWMFTFSLKSNREIFGGNIVGLPENWEWANYAKVFEKAHLGRYLFNSTVVTGLTIAFTLILSAMATYAIVRLKWKLSKFVYFIFLTGMMLSIHAVLLPLFVMASLGKGTFEDVAAFGPFGPDQDALLAEQYPYLGIDSRSGRFEAAPFEVEALAGAFARKLGALADRSLFSDASTLVVRLGDALAMRGEHERACDFVRLLASRAPRASWLAKHGAALLEAACLVPACEVHRSLSGETAGKGALLSAHEAVRRALLGDRQAACVAARKAVRDRNAPSSVQMTGALVLAQCAEADERRRADKLVVSLLAAAGIADAAEAPREAVCAKAPEDRGWLAAGCVHAQLRKAGCPEAARVWLDWHDDGARGSFLKQSAAEVLRQAAASGAGEARSIELDRLGAFVRKEVSQASRGTLGLGDALAGIAYERACERGAIAVPALDAQAALAVRRIEMRLFSQRNACERLELERLERERVFVATHPDAYREEGRATRLPKLPSSVPALTVNLFGGLDVLMGDERVDPSLFSRQKVKTLLALLVLHNGREFSRDKLVGLLWPDSEIMHGRKNFYGIWAMLRRALTLPSGECPYLIRQQQGLRLDASLLTSDVAQLEDVCRTLLFERPGYGGWAQVYSQVNDRFSDDLLPSENGNDALASLRVDYRNRLVDALVAASTRLVAAGEAQEGLWFARAALQRDRSREDAYICLMQAQLAAGQRTAALETYFACRRFLTDELGIDPSLETMRLYRSIIETETDFE